jgi:hypothetical protein
VTTLAEERPLMLIWMYDLYKRRWNFVELMEGKNHSSMGGMGHISTLGKARPAAEAVLHLTELHPVSPTVSSFHQCLGIEVINGDENRYCVHR